MYQIAWWCCFHNSKLSNIGNCIDLSIIYWGNILIDKLCWYIHMEDTYGGKI